MPHAIIVNELEFAYPGQGPGKALFRRFSLRVEAGSRCLLLGQNGVGKTTLLRILGGKHMVPKAAVTVLGTSAFHDTALSGRVVFLGGPFPFDVDLTVAEILGRRVSPPDRRRRDRLLDLLGIDLSWSMMRLSSGQRRRVQVLLGLLDPMDVVLLDEVTADLDVLSRADLLGFLQEESERHGTTIVYATHVLDGLSRWATHLCFLSPGPEGSRVRTLAPLSQVPELLALQEQGAPAPLLQLCERWLREDRAGAEGTEPKT